MKAVVVSSARGEDLPMQEMTGVLQGELERAGFDAIERFEVASEKLAYCQGEFDCWLKHPGRCKIQDAAQRIAASASRADAVVYASRISFGGFDYHTKLAIDRMICQVLPFFEDRSSLTHHETRYGRRPRVYAVGMLREQDAAQREIFDALNDANAVNWESPGRATAVLEEGASELWRAPLRTMFEAPPLRPGQAITGRAALRQELLSAARPELLPAFGPVRSAALLIGSAKPKGSSASELLASEIARLLGREGVTCTLYRATQFVHDDERALSAARDLAAADLFVACSPLYVDAFPALVTHAFELVARVHSQGRDALFVPLVQCGFPEPEQTRTALRIAREFARAARYHYAGGLPLGAGGVISPERSLEQGRAPIHHVARALRLAVPALAAGESVPERALQELLKPGFPEPLYRLAADVGFRFEARRRGAAQRELRAMPFAPERR